MEKPVKNKKRMLLYSILAITIGIATILPLSYITLRTEEKIQTQPFFTPHLTSISITPSLETVYSELYQRELDRVGTAYYYDAPNEAGITVDMCCDITPHGADLEDVDAKIEIYNFHFYSHKGSILNMTIGVAITGKVSDPNAPNGVTTAITGSSGYAHYDNPIDWANHKTYYEFADGTICDLTQILGYVESDQPGYQTDDWITAAKGHCPAGSVAVLSEFKGEKTAQALTNLRNAKTIYVDITRIMQITYKHPNSLNTSSVITVTPTSKEVLYHIQMPEELNDLGIMTYETSHKSYTPTFRDGEWK